MEKTVQPRCKNEKAASSPLRVTPGNVAATGSEAEAWGNAHWIWSGKDDRSEADTWMDFRRDFTLEEVPRSSEIKIAVSSKYWLYVNGQEVVWEGGLIQGPNADDTYYDVVDIGPYLRSGGNSIAVQVYYFGKGTHAGISGSGGLLISTGLTDAETGHTIETGDGNWWSLKNPANFHDVQISNEYLSVSNEVYDANQEIDWINPDYRPEEQNWAKSIVVGEDEQSPGYPGDAPWNTLWERPIPQWKDYGRKALALTPVEGYSTQLAKPLSDFGITSEIYSIESNILLNVVSNAYAKRANVNFLFGISDARNYYKATINCVDFLAGGNRPVLEIYRGTRQITAVDISNILTPDNYQEIINIKLDVVSHEKADIYLNSVLVYTLFADIASPAFTFGYGGNGVSTFFPSLATIQNVTIQDDQMHTYVNCFQTEADAAIFPGCVISDKGLCTTDFNMCSICSGNGQKYAAQLPYNCQMVPYLLLGNKTECKKEIVMYTDTADVSNIRAIYITKNGYQDFESKLWISGDFLYFDIPNGVELLEVGFRETGYAVESGKNTDFVGYFDSVLDITDTSIERFHGGHTWQDDEAGPDNNVYDELWKKATRTLYLTIRDIYMDCPDRERGQYMGDAVNEIEEAFYSLGTHVNALTAKAIREICDHQYSYVYNGRTYYCMSNVRPGSHTQEINIQSLGTAYAAWTYYQFTGDQELLRYCYQKLYNYLTNYDMETKGRYAGSVRPRDRASSVYNRLVDWTDWGNNQDYWLATTLWWYISATSVRSMADVEGVDATQEQKDWLNERLTSIREHFEAFWNENLKAYATDWDSDAWTSPVATDDGSHLVDDRVNALAVVFGLVPPERYGDMRNVFMGTAGSPAYESASIYMEKYVIQALYMMGYDQDAMARMSKRMINMVNSKTDSTLWEEWTRLSDGKVRTKNHGWSGGSMIALSRYAAGVEPTAPGYEVWHVIPQMGKFSSINTCVPSEIGNIHVTLNRDMETDTLEMTVVSPGGAGEVWVPIKEGQAVGQTTGAAAEYLGIEAAYQKKYAVYALSNPGKYGFTASAAMSSASLSLNQRR